MNSGDYFFVSEFLQELSIAMQIVRLKSSSVLSPITKQELHGRQPLDTIVPFPCIRQLRPRYERQSKPWCPVTRLRFRMLRLKTEETPVFFVCKQKQEFIATEAI